MVLEYDMLKLVWEDCVVELIDAEDDVIDDQELDEAELELEITLVDDVGIVELVRRELVLEIEVVIEALVVDVAVLLVKLNGYIHIKS